MKRVICIGIAGPSGSGKTSLANKITAVIPKVNIISMDNYLDPSRNIIDENFDDPRLVDFDLLCKNLENLKNGDSTLIPEYNFRTSTREKYNEMVPPDSNIVVIEGIYALHEMVRKHLDLKISISGGVHFDLIKRILRDVRRTGQQPSEALQQITETVYPMYKAFIEPDLQHADIQILNKFNPFSGLLNPIYIMKSTKEVNQDQVKKVLDSESLKGPTEAHHYDIYLRPPDSNPKSCNDWIRVRNSDGKYTIMFSEEIKEGGFIISPRVNFVVNVKILGGLMALGYQIGAIIHRKSLVLNDNNLVISFDHIQELDKNFVQIKGFDRKTVSEAGKQLGLEGTYVPIPYIMLYMEYMENMTNEENREIPLPAPKY